MIKSVEEHQQAVLGLLRYSSGYGADGTEEQLRLTQARGRVLASDVLAPVSLPPFDNSQMDGYAVHLDDLGATDAPMVLRVAPPIPAGIEPPALERGSAAPIMTGAMIPADAGAVVPIEKAVPAQFYAAEDFSSGREQTVELPQGIQPGAYIRRTGSDIGAGATALPAGTVLGAAQLGLLAGCGIAEVTVRPRFTVLLLATGDEVQEPGAPAAPGKIYDANNTLLESALQEAGANVRRHRLMNDNPVELRKSLDTLSGSSINLILTTGGISQGAYEVVKQALADSSVEFLSVAMQPGGPQAIGSVGGVPFLGFPGNPVSAIVSFEMFLRPALSAVVGAPHPRVQLNARLAEAAESPEGKHQLRRGWYSDGTVELIGGPSSHLIHALAESNTLVHLPAGKSTFPEGDTVAVWLLDGVRASSHPVWHIVNKDTNNDGDADSSDNNGGANYENRELL